MAPINFFPFLYFALWHHSCPHSHSQVHGNCIKTERIALLSIKAGMWSNNKSFLSSWTGHDCCNWRGVSCNNETGHVTKLDLQYPYYDPIHPIPPPSKLNSSLIQLHHLNYLDLSNNDFQGFPIPDFIGSLANLDYLNLSNAEFSGILPHTFGNLSCFGVDLSNVHGWLHDINMLPSLLVLKLSNAGLRVGGIHGTTLLHHLNFTSLRVLDLSMNYDLNITLPQWLFHLTSLVHLDLSICALYGKLPVTIGNLRSLRFLSLTQNSFDGVIPESMGNLGSLEKLDLSVNKFNGSIPESLSNLTNLEYFDLSSNQVQGLMPASIGDLETCNTDLSRNMISGALSRFLGNLTLLQYFSASGGNNLSGNLPETIGNLVHLQFLDLSKKYDAWKVAGEFW
ncbi:probable inactive leucine-rich repeat receptor kinase XIAO [Dioscorea cayenensis subsp. rotundata]|uniref:Probable inactive leucine-rich repeat receptor kinase XIAO n=1 Tax=Dioscorea cayennensis subsp. rotundata TaxID=55577 RepID=A0AB40B2M9_DIOCR|nr:probable inactive leucine-rich repeat receptor kinase XIAO [Dioscorea cayenensis subsp. rotundata]